MSKGIFVVFNGYIDESFDNKQKFFALSCVTGTGKHWLEMERIWKLHLEIPITLKMPGARILSVIACLCQRPQTARVRLWIPA